MRSIRPYLTLAAVLFLLAACERPQALVMSSPEMRPLRLAAPEHGFRLDPHERAKVVAGFDVDALERLLGMVRPDMRKEILRHFQPGEPGERRRGALTEFFDPQLQAVLEEVWAPMWDDAPIEALEEGWYYYPGREIARQRRAAKQRAEERRDRSE